MKNLCFRRVAQTLGMLLISALTTAGTARAELKVGLVLDRAGKDDRSFNAAAYLGATKAKEDLKISLKYVEASDDNAFEGLIRALSQKDFDLIIGIGVSQAEALRKVARQFPQKHYAIVDAEVNEPNVRSLLFEEHEGSFLVGAIAGLTSKTGKVGFVGGMDIPLIRRFEKGFAAGVRNVKPDAKVTANYIGVTGDAWNNPAKGKELALAQYSGGADVIFAAAGSSNAGVFDAAEERKKFAIGVDSNQNYVKPGYILTSMLKRVDIAVFEAILDAHHGKFVAGTKRFGLKNQGVDYALDDYNKKLLSKDLLRQVEQLKLAIINGKLEVPDYYKLKK